MVQGQRYFPSDAVFHALEAFNCTLHPRDRDRIPITRVVDGQTCVTNLGVCDEGIPMLALRPSLMILRIDFIEFILRLGEIRNDI